ncbi:hypothetical protein F8M41_026342 [Gigaspora margarita]|uniref:Uncharacterized protein n=1 Tax=Gigaspora margarita TaxID=4874 RepID=A0A8H4AZP2_GIGMA|nr:hypothetical protein F8M41_026342 [Gigaspora margarita]
MEEEHINYFQPMMKQLVKDYEVELQDGFYITNIFTSECPLCLDYIWNGPFYEPLELNKQQLLSNGSPAKLTAKPCKPSHILLSAPDNESNRISPSEQKRKTMNIRKSKCEYKGKQKENIPKKSKISVEISEIISQQLPADIPQQVATSDNQKFMNATNQPMDKSQEFIEKFNAARQHVLNILNLRISPHSSVKIATDAS